MRRLARGIATLGGLGRHAPWPGTWGAAAALPLAWASADWTPAAYLVGLALGSALAVWAADQHGRALGAEDAQEIIIDETVGLLATTAWIDRSSFALLLASFLLFRALDITKPGPVRWAERHLRGGLAVVGDDLVAGLLAGALLAGALAAAHYE